MNSKEISPTIVSLDLDGTVMPEIFPSIPSQKGEKPYRTSSPFKEILIQKGTALTSKVRGIKPEAIELFDYLHQNGFPTLILSGRPEYLREITIKKLRRAGVLDYIEDIFLILNNQMFSNP